MELIFPKEGNLAPVFSLENQKGEVIFLKDYRGKKNIVLYFYPRALTPGCTVQACEISLAKKRFLKEDTVVLGVSPDEVKKLSRFTEKKELNFDLLSDPDHKVAEKYGVWALKKFMGREYIGIHRVTFIIGKDGKLKHIMKKVKTKTHHDDVLNYIQTNL